MQTQPSKSEEVACVFTLSSWQLDGELVKRVIVYTACSNQSDCLKFDKEITASHTLRTVKFLLNKCEELSCLYLQVCFKSY